MRTLLIIIIIFITTNICSAEVCNEFRFKDSEISCSFVEGVATNSNLTADALICFELMDSKVCKDTPNNRCGFSWEYPRQYENLDVVRCFVNHSGSLFQCDPAGMTREQSTKDARFDVLQVTIPSCLKDDEYYILKRKVSIDPTHKGFEKTFVFGGKDFEETAGIEVVIPSDENLIYLSSWGTKPEIKRIGNRTHYLWQKHNVEPVIQEDFMPPEYASYDNILVSTERNFTQLRDWLLTTYSKKPVSQSITNLSKNIKGDAKGESAIQLMYDWIRKNIQYEKDKFDPTIGFTPKTPDESVEAMKGDCKDMSVLLSDLLNAQGFSAEPALCCSYHKEAFKSAFDHVIVKVEYNNKSIWLDPTCPVCPFGVLTPNMYGKYVFPLSATDVEEIPENTNPDYVTSVNMTFDLTKMDPVRITYNWEYGDLMSAEEQREKLQPLSPQGVEGFYQQQARKLCQYPRLIEKDIINLNDSLKPLTVHLVYDCPGIVRVEGDMLRFMVGTEGQLPEHLAPITRHNDIYLEGSEFTGITTRVIFPEGYEIATKPIEYNYTDEDYSFIQSAEVKGNTLTLDSKSYLSRLIPKEKYSELRKAYQAQLNTRQEIVAKKTNGSTIAIAFLAIVLLFLAALILRKKRR